MKIQKTPQSIETKKHNILKMKIYIKPSKFLQQLIVVFVLFILFPITIVAQTGNMQDRDRIDFIDEELSRLNFEKEAIGREFERISNFSVQATPILAGYNQIVEAIELKNEEIRRSSFGLQTSEARNQKEAEIQSLIAQRDNYLRQFRNSNGVISYDNKVKSNTIGDLQNDWQRTSNYYLERKTRYDNINLQLGNLNKERHEIVSKIEYYGGGSLTIDDKWNDLEGCWSLRTGKYTSKITVTEKTGQVDGVQRFVGYLTVNNLNNYVDGQLMFSVERKSFSSFVGTEYTVSEPDPISGSVHFVPIRMEITISNDGLFLTWTSDETVTMQRCNN